MVSSLYSESVIVTGSTPGVKFVPAGFRGMKFYRGPSQSTGHRFHRVRHENLHNFEKNPDQNGSLWKKLEHFEIGRPKFLRSKISKIFIDIFIGNCMKMKKYGIENF